LQRFGGMMHRLPVGLAAHDDGDELGRGGHKNLAARPKNEGSVLDEGTGRRKRGPPCPLFFY
ncbi:MAG: hypothetical protein P4L68_02465, partial [Methylovirgula sp.]|nr:hypothetical protein [Methylovirgula sp.]